MHPDPLIESEIHAYLDGELDLRRQIAVETHLAENPQAAQRFMHDLRLSSSLRLMAEELDAPRAAMVEAAARLSARQTALREGKLRLMLGGGPAKMAVAAALLAVILVPARIVLAGRPGFVGDAVQAYHTGLLRAQMVSQVETPHLDAKEVQRSTHIRIPKLPAHWVVTDAQIFPSEDGPALQIMINTPSDEKMSIFAVRADTTAPEEPRTVRQDGTSVAYWRQGDMSYALAGDGKLERLGSAADGIADQN